MQTNSVKTDSTARQMKPIEVPEDVLAELDAEERRVSGEARLPTADVVPEDTCSELDREARLGGEELRVIETEGQPPAADD